MIRTQKIFSYLNYGAGVTKDGEQYAYINVLDKDTSAKLNFVTKDPAVIDTVRKIQLDMYHDIRLILDFNKVFNKKTRYSNWQVELVGCEY